ncbi:MAG: hypothetical protein HZA16_10020 [Nitrospirae bacterium]|nr:hypothetical protein [Nitrospirota bacterium]
MKNLSYIIAITALTLLPVFNAPAWAGSDINSGEVPVTGIDNSVQDVVSDALTVDGDEVAAAAQFNSSATATEINLDDSAYMVSEPDLEQTISVVLTGTADSSGDGIDFSDSHLDSHVDNNVGLIMVNNASGHFNNQATQNSIVVNVIDDDVLGISP